jgi:glyoxylase-like metal-dependent hydrolase (beta-lactamase superfamily II)
MIEYGSELVPKSLSVLGGGSHVITTPIFGAVVETEDGLILLDTGISPVALADGPALTAIYGAGMHPWGVGGNPIETALATLGFTVADIALACISHLHLDHTGGIPLLAAAGVPIAIQGRELEYGLQKANDGTELDVAFYRDDYVGRDVDWRLLDGDEQLAPGVWSFSTPGHTPGHMSYRVELEGTGNWLFAADAADLGENLLERVACGSVCEASDARRARASIHRIMEEGDALGARVIPGHDAVFWKAVWHPPGGHR